MRDVMRLTDEVGSPYTDEVILRGHDWTEAEAREAVTGWLLDEGICDTEAESAEWWAGLAWLDHRETRARKIPYRDGGPRSWTLHYPQDRGPGAFPVTVVEHRTTIRRRLHDAARRQCIKDAARAEWPDADIYQTSGYRGGYLHADVGPVRVRVTWQEGGARVAPVCYLRADVPDVTRYRIQRAVARIHAAALAHQTTHPDPSSAASE